MRSLCIALGIVSCVSWTLTGRGEPAAVVPPESVVPAEASLLLEETERIAAAGSMEDCDALEPIPLYEGGPSADDWRAYCRAVVMRSREECGGITGTMLPDLRLLCSTL